ncbi:MAG: ABC transporter permease [Christensenellales bacterium]|jgi:lipopolysaccharide transport system permease protein
MKKSDEHITMLKGRIVNLYKFRDLLTQLIARDIKMKYRRSFLGYLWSVLSPLLIMLVQALVFSMMFKRNIQYFPAYLIAGNVLFNYMRESSGHSIVSITGNAALLKKTYVPKYVFTLSRVTSDFINMFFSFGALILVLIFTGVPFTWYALLFFIPVIEIYIFCVGLGMFLSQMAVFFRDIQYIWGVVTTAWMYLTPLFYDIEFLPKTMQWIIVRFNPLYYYITQFRDLVVYGRMPSSLQILFGGLISVLMLAIGIWRFLRSKDKFILHI